MADTGPSTTPADSSVEEAPDQHGGRTVREELDEAAFRDDRPVNDPTVGSTGDEDRGTAIDSETGHPNPPG